MNLRAMEGSLDYVIVGGTGKYDEVLSMDFYNQIADSYDEMTNLDSHMDSIRSFVKRIKDRYELRTAIDATCGTGGHVIVMSQMCIQAVGVDISGGMLDKARAAAKQNGVKPRWINASAKRS